MIIIAVFILIPLFVFNLCKTYRENFPQTSNLNVLYTDQNGNLGATSDLGIDKLTVNSESQIRGNQTVKGTQYVDGIIYTSGKRNLPSGWGGGLRTWDVYASGTIATGDDSGNIKASISNDGNASFNNIYSPTINNINTTLSSLQTQITSLQNQINTINSTLGDISNNIVRKDKRYAIVNDAANNNLTGNTGAVLHSNYCSPDGKWKFVQQNSGKTC